MHAHTHGYLQHCNSAACQRKLACMFDCKDTTTHRLCRSGGRGQRDCRTGACAGSWHHSHDQLIGSSGRVLHRQHININQTVVAAQQAADGWSAVCSHGTTYSPSGRQSSSSNSPSSPSSSGENCSSSGDRSSSCSGNMSKSSSSGSTISRAGRCIHAS